MKAGILYQDRDIRVGNAPDPSIKADEVLVKTNFAGICGTDLHIYRGEFHGRVNYPAIQGHEFGGTIEQLGKDVRNFSRNERVVVDPILSCHNCPACFSGHLNACQTLKLLGVDVDGGYGQYVAVPSNRLFRLPENVPEQFAPMVEMYGLGHHILQRGQVQLGETVAILGAGKLGLSVLDVLCHSVGANRTLAADLQPFRLEIAGKLGADQTVDIRHQDPVAVAMEMTDGLGVDCVIECVGHYHQLEGQESPLAQAVKMIRNGGRIVTAGLGEQLSPVHFKTLVLKEASIFASRVTRGEFPQALRLMSKGVLHPEMLITEQLPIRDISEAFCKVDGNDPATIKIVLDVQQA
jgi:threonine dehydrogenase-like Zn-dependent dehydrogenase